MLNLLASVCNLVAFLPSLTCEPYLVFAPLSTPKFYVSVPTMYLFDDDDSGDENPTLHAHFPLVTPTQSLPQWVRTTSDLASDPGCQY